MELLIVALITLVAMAVALVLAMRHYNSRRRRDQFASKYRSEYELEARRRGEKNAERELTERERRVARYSLRPLNRAEYERFSDHWASIQERFVDDPVGAMALADRLVTDLMATRGYPRADFEQRAADLSVDHPKLVNDYRAARRVAEDAGTGQATTEQMRAAFVGYRKLFDELLELDITVEAPSARHAHHAT